MLKNTTKAVAIFMALTSNAGAATLSAIFEPEPFHVNRGFSENINDVLSLTATDLAGGGVEFVVTANDTSEGFGSFFLGGFSSTDFFSPSGFVSDPSERNVYTLELGPGTVFVVDQNVSVEDSVFFDSGSISYFTRPDSGFTTDDFLSAPLGVISVTPEFVGSLGAAYSGRFVMEASPIPLPASLPLLAGALLGAGWLGRKAKRSV